MLHHCQFERNELPDGCAKLIIADPPYFEVKGDFDFTWPDFEAYLSDVEKWAAECKRILAPNGSLFWWGHARKIAYSQVILDKYFYLENSCVWRKPDCQAKKNAPDSMRSYAPVTERCLFYSNFSQSELDWRNNNAAVYNEIWEPVRLYLRAEITKIGIKKAAALLGVSDRAVGHYTSRSQFYTPTRENYEFLQKEADLFPMPWSDFSEWVESVKEKAERDSSGRRTFDNGGVLQEDVWDFMQQSHISAKYDHPTQKPETLTGRLILTTTRPGDLVVVPFAGSGTECAMSVRLGRKFEGYEIDEKHFFTASKRIKSESAQLF